MSSNLHETDAQQALTVLDALPEGSVVLLTGGTDTGKTTFLRSAANHLTVVSGLTVALVDADTGQSEIGPPAAVSFSLLTPRDKALPLQSLTHAPITGTEFVGAVVPNRCALDWLTAVVRCVGRAQESQLQAARIIVDLPGYVSGPTASGFLRHLTSLLQPALVLAFAHGSELDGYMTPLRGRAAPPIVAVVRPGAEVGRKTPPVRAARRTARFAAYFKEAHPITLSWESVVFLNTMLGQGTALLPHLRRFVSDTLQTNCLYAEQGSDRALRVMLDRPARRADNLSLLEQQFRTKNILLTPASAFEGLLCGLLGTQGEFLGAGLIEHVDYDAREITLAAPRLTGPPVQIAFGAVRLRRDGRELEQLRSGVF